jgi:hypothetical protein
MCIFLLSENTNKPLHVLTGSGVVYVEADGLKVQLTLFLLLAATFGSLQDIAAYSYTLLLNYMLQDGVEGWSVGLVAQAGGPDAVE